jgi:hypothetical protein
MVRVAETLAMSVLRTWFPGSTVTFVERQSHGEHDIELVHPDGRRGIVEVASIVDADNLETIAAILHSKHGDTIQARKSKGGWYIHPSNGAPINRLHTGIDSCLASLEAAGINSFDSHMLGVPANLIAELGRLGVEGGDVVDFIRPGTIKLGLPSDGGWLGTSIVNGAVLDAAQRADNLRKLSASDAQERHIFVFMESSAGAPYLALFLGEDLPAAPRVPQPITHVWVGAYLSTLQDAMVWQSINNGGWTRHRVRIAGGSSSDDPEGAV